MTVRGTPCTWYFIARWGNSVASTMSAETRSLAIASLCASTTARGQYGQVGVTNTWMCTGRVSVRSAAIVSSLRPGSPLPSIRRSSISDENS